MNDPDDKSPKISKAPPPITPLRGSGYSPAIASSKPKAPDWNYWRQIPKTELWKAVTLSCNAEPRSGAHADFWNDRQRWGPDRQRDGPHQEFLDRIDIARAHLATKGKLEAAWINMGDATNSGVYLAGFATWALSMQWNIPQEFADMAKTEIKAENPDATKTQPIPELGTRERETVLKIIAGFLAQGFKPTEISQPYTIAREIQEALQSSGLELSDDTIAKWIKDAAALLTDNSKTSRKS